MINSHLLSWSMPKIEFPSFNFKEKAEKLLREAKEKTKRSESMQKLFDEMEERAKAKHNPIVSFDSAVLDTSDGDFSVKINGQDFYWIDEQPIIEIADYIEEQLKTDC